MRPIEEDRLVRPGRWVGDRREKSARLLEETPLDQKLREERRRPLRLGRNTPVRKRLERGTQLGLGLLELAAQEQRVATPQLDARDREDGAGAMAFSPHFVVHFQSLVQVGHEERQRGDDARDAVCAQELAAGKRGPGELDHGIGRPGALSPFPRCDRGEHLGADSVGGVDRPPGPQSLEPVRIVSRAEEDRDQLVRLDAATEVLKPGRQLEDGAAGELRCLVRVLHEAQRAGEPVGRMTAQAGLGGALVRVLEVPRRVGQ